MTFGTGADGHGIVLQGGDDPVFTARLLIELVAVFHQQFAPFRGDADGLAGVGVIGVDLDEQAVDIGRDAHVGAQLLRDHVHLQTVDDFGGAPRAIEISDMVIKRLLGGLRQAEIAAAGHDQHLLRGAVDRRHLAAEEEGGAGGDNAEQQHDPAAADEDASVVDEVHAGILA